MTRPTPTLSEILAEFEREAARAPRWASVDRDLLLRVCGELRRLQAENVRLDAEAQFWAAEK